MSEEIIKQSASKRNNKSKMVKILLATFCFVLISTFFIYQHLSAPVIKNNLQTFEVEKGMSVKDIAEKANSEGIVRSELLLYTLLTWKYDPTNIHAGTYLFTNTDDLYSIAEKLASQAVEQELVSITIPEGVRLAQIADIASNSLPEFNVDDYLTDTNELEGYLFPETYFVPKTFTADDLIALQRSTYEEKVGPLRSKIEESDYTEYEVLILASIIEREANDEESMKMVSGILQNRLNINMPLQADATIEYSVTTPLNELPEGQLATELRETESPYNTYKNTGLTPTPIGNPGLMSIKAVLEPTISDYFYYLTDENGQFYYAETLAKHNQNIQKYLR